MRWDWDRGARRPAMSRRRARDGPRAAANRRDTWRYDRLAAAEPAGLQPVTPLPAPRCRGRRRASPAGAPHTGQDAQELRARGGRQAKLAESILVLEVQLEALVRVRPTNHALRGAIEATRHIHNLVRLAERNEDLAALGEPTR